MPRSLPLSDHTYDTLPVSAAPNITPGSSAPLAGTLQGTVKVFDPAMCCATGVCGPGVDPALLQITRDLRWLASQGVAVERVGLSQEPQAFVANPGVAGLLQAFGDAALPAVLVNDVILTHGRYATREEVVAALSSARCASSDTATSPESLACAPQNVGTEGPGCAPGSGCC